MSLPERRYDLAGDLLAAAIDEARGVGGGAAAACWPGWPSSAAGSWAEAARARADGAGDAVLRVLEEHGFEPRVEDDAVTLANCPFHALARSTPTWSAA